MCFNRGKESIALDIKSPRDRELLERLLGEADVLVENFRPGVMDRLGYGAERLARTHPHLVYASISGFGHTGPFSDLPGYDMVVQAMGGIMSLTGWPDAPPARVGTSFGDLSAALFAAIGIVSSLYKRTRDAQGTRVDIAMLDCQAAMMETALARYDVEGTVPTRTGDCHPSLAPFETFAAQDGRFVIAAGNDQLFMLMADALGSPQLALRAAVHQQRPALPQSPGHGRGDRGDHAHGARGALDRPAQRGGCSLRADQHHRPPVRPSAAAGAQHDHPGQGQGTAHRAYRRQPDQARLFRRHRRGQSGARTGARRAPRAHSGRTDVGYG